MSGSIGVDKMESLQNFHKWLFNSELQPSVEENKASCLIVLAGESDKKKIAGHLINMEVDSGSQKKMGNQVSVEYSQTKRTENLTVSGLKLSCKNSSSDKKKSLDAFPVLVLICINSSESRFEGPSSQLTKSLNELEKFNLFNKETPNLIIVVTNACSIPYKKVENWKKKLEDKSRGFQNHIEKVTGIRAPFVAMENLAEDYDLPMTSGGTKLPDGTEQPANLLLVVTEQMKKQRVDHVLLEVIARNPLCKENRDTLIANGKSKTENSAKEVGEPKTRTSGASTAGGNSVDWKRRFCTRVATIITCASVYHFFGGVPAGCTFVLLILLSQKLKLPFFSFGQQNLSKDD